METVVLSASGFQYTILKNIFNSYCNVFLLMCCQNTQQKPPFIRSPQPWGYCRSLPFSRKHTLRSPEEDPADIVLPAATI